MSPHSPLPPGVVLIDKPTDWTSHDVVAKIRGVLHAKKVGHAGTLDPLATGLMIVLIGREATKLQDQFMKQDKTYVCAAQLGVETDTYDRTGQIVRQVEWGQLDSLLQENGQFNRSKIEAALTAFQGQITQTVPPYSAVKVKGQKLYDQARKGTLQLTELPHRQVNIARFELLTTEVDVEKQLIQVEFVIDCSSGTYIRSLIHDLGQALGIGAMVTELRRTRIGKYSIDQAKTLEEFLNSRDPETSMSWRHAMVQDDIGTSNLTFEIWTLEFKLFRQLQPLPPPSGSTRLQYINTVDHSTA